MKETIEGWSVLVTRKDGTEFLSISKNAGRHLFCKRSEAAAWKRELKPHLGGKLKVVRVRATFQVIEKGGK